ncbi:MAG TPA: hypothetical protein VF278_21195 [Pirellulales bacterium]
MAWNNYGRLNSHDRRGPAAMDDTICYLNTDLEIDSLDNLTNLASALKASGMWSLCEAMKGDDGLWHTRFETNADYNEPEPNIAAMIAAIESLDESLRADWSRCSLREFNIGYDCGSKPWAFNQGLSNELLGRIAAIGASLRWTLYPPECPKSS